MNNVIMLATAAAIAVMACGTAAMAGPSAQINIPSTDAKALKEVTIGITNNVRFSTAADAGANLLDIGVTTGLLPYEKLKLEIGADYVTAGGTPYPFTFNAKLATTEDALFSGLPAFAIGGYNLGTIDDSHPQNIVYALAAKTLPVIGRFSLGGYNGAKKGLGDKSTGLLASWDRTISEVSDKLWLGIEYMSGKNADGEVSVGGSWAFSKQITLLTGVTFYNDLTTGGRSAFTTQLSINLP